MRYSKNKSYVMFKKNPLSVAEPGSGTYLFFLPRSTARSLRTRVWQPRVWQTSFRPIRHARSYLSNYISRRPRRFLFRFFPHARENPERSLARLVYISFSLSPQENRCFVARMLVARSSYYQYRRRTLEKEISMHKYIRVKRASRSFHPPNQTLSSSYLSSSFTASLCFPIFRSFFLLRVSFFLLHPFIVHRAMAIRTFFQFPE